MKKILTKGLLAFVIAALFAACTPSEHKELGSPRDIIQSLEGTWKLSTAIQTDEDASKKGFPFKELDITSLFPYTDFVLTLNLNNGLPGTFTTNSGSSPKIIKFTNGSWVVDDAAHPKNITLTSGTATETVTLGSYPVGPANTLQLRVERKDASTGKELISYDYEFTKQ